MFCKKSFSRILFSLFAVNALNSMVPIFAMENESPASNYNEKWFYKQWINDEWDKRKRYKATHILQFYNFWCRKFPHDNDGTSKTEYNRFIELLKQHKQLFADCDITLKKDIKDIYEEIFKAVFDNLCSNKNFYVSDNVLDDSGIPDDILRKYTSLPKLKYMASDFWFTCRNTLVSSYAYYYPCTHKDKGEGNLVFTIELAETLRLIDLKFELSNYN